MDPETAVLHESSQDEPACRNAIPTYDLRTALIASTLDCLDGKVVDLAAVGAQVDEVVSAVARCFLGNPNIDGNFESLCNRALVAVAARLRSLGGHGENGNLYAVASSVRDFSQVTLDELQLMKKGAERDKDYAEELHCRLELVHRENLLPGEYSYNLLRIAFCADRVGDLDLALDYYQRTFDFLEKDENANLSEQSLKYQCRHQIFRLRALLGLVENPEVEEVERLRFYEAALAKVDTKPLDRLLALKGLTLVHKQRGELVQALGYSLTYLDEGRAVNGGSSHTARAAEGLRALQREMVNHTEFSMEEIADLPTDCLVFLAKIAESAHRYHNAIESRRAILQKQDLDDKNKCINLERLRLLYEAIEDNERALETVMKLQQFLEADRQDNSRMFRAQHDIFRLKEKSGKSTEKDRAERQRFYEDFLDRRQGGIFEAIIALDNLVAIAEAQGRAEDALDYSVNLLKLETKAGRHDTHKTNAGIARIGGFLDKARAADITDVVENLDALLLRELKFWVRVSKNFPAERVTLAEALLARPDCDADGVMRARLALSYVYEDSGYFDGALKEMQILITFQSARGLDATLSGRRQSALRERARG